MELLSSQHCKILSGDLHGSAIIAGQVQVIDALLDGVSIEIAFEGKDKRSNHV